MNCYEQTRPPYQLCSSTATTSDRERQSTVASVDRVQCRSKWSNSVHFIELYPETREVLEWCVANSLVMTICSKSPDHNVIMAVMDAFEIWDWFLFPQIYSKQKSVHFQALTTLTGLPYTSFLFFDDNSANIKTCKEMGICSLLVDRSTGLNWESMVRGLDTYRNVEVSRSGIYSWLSSS